jgi:hypothetical protein
MRHVTLGSSQGIFSGCDPEGRALQWRLKCLYARTNRGEPSPLGKGVFGEVSGRGSHGKSELLMHRMQKMSLITTNDPFRNFNPKEYHVLSGDISTLEEGKKFLLIIHQDKENYNPEYLEEINIRLSHVAIFLARGINNLLSHYNIRGQFLNINDIGLVLHELMKNAYYHGNQKDLTKSVLVIWDVEQNALVLGVGDHSEQPFHLDGNPFTLQDVHAAFIEELKQERLIDRHVLGEFSTASMTTAQLVGRLNHMVEQYDPRVILQRDRVEDFGPAIQKIVSILTQMYPTYFSRQGPPLAPQANRLLLRHLLEDLYPSLRKESSIVDGRKADTNWRLANFTGYQEGLLRTILRGFEIDQTILGKAKIVTASKTLNGPSPAFPGQAASEALNPGDPLRLDRYRL